MCYDTIERAEAVGSDLVLIDTAGRLHTSDDLMRELQKVVSVVRKRSNMPVRTVLVIDATTGQNGLSQAREFDRALDLDAIIVTKLDGTAKGGIALAVSHELGLPIAKIGVGESLEDLQDFDAHDFAAALIGAEPVEQPADADEGEEDSSYAEETFEPEDDQEREPDEPDEFEFGEDVASDEDAASEEEHEEELEFEEEPEPEGDEEPESDDEEPEAEPDEEPEAEPEPEEEQPAKKGRFKRLFKWRGRNDD